MNKERIKKMALGSGFKLKEQLNGEMDLNPYVYRFADMVESAVIHEYESGRKDNWIRAKEDWQQIKEHIDKWFEQEGSTCKD